MQQKVEELRAHLAVVKQSPPDKIDEDFYNLMLKAKDALGQSVYQMAQFYYEYGHYILQKIESNMDIFNEQAIPNNAQEQDSNLVEDIPEEFNQSDQSEGLPQEELPVQESHASAVANEQPQIVEVGANQSQEHNSPGQQKEEQEDIEDKQICSLNLQMALRLYEQERSKVLHGQSTTSLQQILDGLRRTMTRLGDLYMLDENYKKCIQFYEKVITQEQQREGFECNRLVSQLYYLIGNSYLYENEVGCESKAINEFIKSVNILLNYLSLTLGYDISNFEIPSEEKVKVERFSYMCLPADSEDVKEIKDILSSLLDKIEDTHSQISINQAYLQEKKKQEVESKNNEFKPVEDQTKVIHLGNFGNRRKKAEEPEKTPLQQSKHQGSSLNKLQGNPSSLKNQENTE